jgi:hypothetical protein
VWCGVWCGVWWGPYKRTRCQTTRGIEAVVVPETGTAPRSLHTHTHTHSHTHSYTK